MSGTCKHRACTESSRAEWACSESIRMELTLCDCVQPKCTMVWLYLLEACTALLSWLLGFGSGDRNIYSYGRTCAEGGVSHNRERRLRPKCIQGIHYPELEPRGILYGLKSSTTQINTYMRAYGSCRHIHTVL